MRLKPEHVAKEEVCHCHYQGFVPPTRALLSVYCSLLSADCPGSRHMQRTYTDAERKAANARSLKSSDVLYRQSADCIWNTAAAARRQQSGTPTCRPPCMHLPFSLSLYYVTAGKAVVLCMRIVHGATVVSVNLGRHQAVQACACIERVMGMCVGWAHCSRGPATECCWPRQSSPG